MLRVAGRLLPMLRSQAWRLPLIVLVGLLASLAEGIGIGLFIPFLENLEQTNPSHSDAWLAEALGSLFTSVPEERRLAVITTCIFLSILLRASLTFWHRVLFHSLDARFIHHLRSLIVSRLLHVDYGFYAQTDTGSIINTLANETWRSSEALAELVNFVTKAGALLVYGVLLVLISWRFTLLIFLIMGCIWWVSRRISVAAERQGREATRASDDAMVRQIELVEGMTTIRVNARERYEQRRFDATSRTAANAIRRVAITRDCVAPVYESLAAIFLVAFLYTVLQAGQPLSVMLVFLLALYRLQPLGRMLEESRIHVVSLGGAVDAVCDLISGTAPHRETGSAERFERLHREVRFDRVSFRYTRASPPALEDVTVRLPAGGTVALVGRSGAGKTTLVNLLARFHVPDSGTITVDGKPLASLDLESWRERLALVSQETYLFNTSIRDNIEYGRAGATFEEIVGAARAAEADDFVQELAGGYDATVGERGLRLSAGQRQRIALARALIRDPAILVLDEATNALDPLSEESIRKALDGLRGTRTMLIVAHRLATVMHADLIVVLENGRVVEQGDYRSLVERSSAFASLYASELRP